MNVTVYPGILKGPVTVPPSKSAAHRFLICAALGDRPCALRLGAMSQDIQATVDCLRALGAAIEGTPELLTIVPGAVPPKAVLDCSESGSTLRFMLPVACALGTEAHLSGRGRLPQRPNHALTEALRAHGCAIDSDLLPMTARGIPTGGSWALPGNISSQYITGLLLALPLLAQDSEIHLTAPLESTAYVDMTLQALKAFGIAVENIPDGWHVPGAQRYRSPGMIEVEGDWSAAAFWLAADEIGSDVRVFGLDPNSPQGDRAVKALLGQPVIDARDVPDLVPALAAAAAFRPGTTTITGAARLRLKESDRLQAIADLLGALGGYAKVTEDGLVIEGGLPLHGGDVDGAGDHRIVMAAAIMATRASAPVCIHGAEAVSKSYPKFFWDFAALGGRIHVE